jgi:hypothetical protein
MDMDNKAETEILTDAAIVNWLEHKGVFLLERALPGAWTGDPADALLRRLEPIPWLANKACIGCPACDVAAIMRHLLQGYPGLPRLVTLHLIRFLSPDDDRVIGGLPLYIGQCPSCRTASGPGPTWWARSPLTNSYRGNLCRRR